jgi:aspartate kinase
MALIIQKFGGSALANLTRIKEVANKIVTSKRRGDRIVVVVSAMGDETDRLMEMAHQISAQPSKRELDMLLTAGERQSIALLGIALAELGCDAVSLTGSQVGIVTDENHTDARIMKIKCFRLQEALKLDKIPVVAGFQGVSISREITTLGRGGSDVTAVALAARLNADRCELYKDVNGLFTEDPKQFRGVKRIAEIPYDEMSELTTSGSQVLHPRACVLAAKYNLNLVIKPAPHLGRTEIGSSRFAQRTPSVTRSLAMTRKGAGSIYDGGEGTMVKNTRQLEKPMVRAITHSANLSRFSLIGVPQQERCLSQAVSQLAQAKIPLVFFAHGVPVGHRFDLSFIIPEPAFKQAEQVLARIKVKLKAEKLMIQKNLGSVSLVGPGIGSDSKIIAALFNTLQRVGVHTDAFSTAESKITCYFNQELLRPTIEHLLDKFNLREKPKR